MPVADVVTVTGRGRLPTDLATELMDVLAEEPGIIVCDLEGMAAPSSAAEVFAPVADYLAHWPGTVVAVAVSAPKVREAVLSSAAAGNLKLLDAAAGSKLSAVRRRVPGVQRAAERLAPLPTASRDARRFVSRTLLDWRLPRLAGPASLVASELVTNSVVHAVTVLDLRLSQAGTLLRVAVRDHGGGRPSPRRGANADSPLDGRGLMIVQAFSIAWGVFPARVAGKTVWAVLDPAAVRDRKASA